MHALFLGAAILGVIIAVMEGEFPGWFPVICCVLASGVPADVVNALLPPGLFVVGHAVGALCGAVVISAVCGMTFQRALIAAAIYFGALVAISTTIRFAFQA